MVDERDLLILSALRKDARTPLSEISKKTAIPLSTVFDRVRRMEASVVTKHTSLIDFAKLGAYFRVHMVVHARDGTTLTKFLMDASQANSVYRVHTGYIVEAVFRSMLELHEFVRAVHANGASYVEEHHILEDMKREGFMSGEDVESKEQ